MLHFQCICVYPFHLQDDNIHSFYSGKLSTLFLFGTSYIHHNGRYHLLQCFYSHIICTSGTRTFRRLFRIRGLYILGSALESSHISGTQHGLLIRKPFFQLCSLLTLAPHTSRHGIICKYSIFYSMEPLLSNFSSNAHIPECIISFKWAAEYLMTALIIPIPIIPTIPGWVAHL